jgi:uncharacterized protein (DUF362 family)
MISLRRRTFIRTAGFAAAGALIGIPNLETSAKENKAKVADVRQPGYFKNIYQPDLSETRKLLDDAIRLFFEVKNPDEGLAELFGPGDRIGIKVNCLSGRSMSTHPQLVNAVIERLTGVGVKQDDIIVFDRSDSDLKRGGFELNTGRGVKVYGVDSSGYSSELLIHRSIGSFTARIMDKVDKIINIPVLKDHGIVGVTICLKNFFGAIHNPNKYHPNGGNPYVADLYSHPLFKDKVKLNIVDGIMGQYEGGPPSQPHWQWKHGGLLMGIDPVAVDRIGLEIIESKRKENNISSLTEMSRFPEYLKTAEALDIGVFELDKIQIIKG